MEEAMAELRLRNANVFVGEEGNAMATRLDLLDGIDSADVFIPLDDLIDGGFQDDALSLENGGGTAVEPSTPLPAEIKLAGHNVYSQIKSYTERLCLEFVNSTAQQQTCSVRNDNEFLLSFSDKRQIKLDIDLLSSSKKQTAAYVLVEDFVHRHVVDGETCQLGLLLLGGAGTNLT